MGRAGLAGCRHFSGVTGGLVVAVGLAGAATGAPPTSAAAPAAGAASMLSPMFPAARGNVERFFGAPFPETPTFIVAPTRAAFNAAFPAAWGMTDTQCWMVGVGVADFLVMLAPEDWAREACEHDAGDQAHVRELLTHELTHSYHGQRNPTRDFTGMDDVGWFVEGLAVLVSRDRQQLREDAGKAIAAGGAPARLAEAWSGPRRYAVAGSLVQYLDETYGRAKILALLPATTESDILQALQLDEPTLLARWRAWASPAPTTPTP